MINIPSHIKDPNYRYTMPKLVCTVQGGGKTRMDNIIDVAKALNVPPDYPLKFIGRELGSQVDIKNDNYLINGSLQADKLQQLLDKYRLFYIDLLKNMFFVLNANYQKLGFLSKRVR